MESKPGEYGIEGLFTHSWFHPAYWKTLIKLLRFDRSKVLWDGSVLHFTNYPFEPASVFPKGKVKADQVAEVNLGYPSKVRLKSGEILFVGPPNKEALVTFLNQTNVTIQRRSSVWSELLSPFLDTWEDQETIDEQFEWFQKLGLNRQAVNRWRREVGVAMIAYNFGTRLWEWAHLDMYDVFIAQRARLSRKKFRDFYTRAMRLAELDPVVTTPAPTFENSIESALFAVLIDWYPREKDSRKYFIKQYEKRSEVIQQLQQRLAAKLRSAYSEPHRHYHTVAHIEHCLRELGSVWSYAIHLNEIRWAILFHDAIYDPLRQDNEARSADWACRVMEELHRPKDESERVRAMILATAHSRDPQTPDEALLCDIDLSILGAEEKTFDEYHRAIRAEYASIPESQYQAGRTEILKSFATRNRLFHTAPFYLRYEASAKRNLQRALG